MMSSPPDVEALVRAAGNGDEAAADRLLGGHRARLRRMIAVYLDRRIAARIDPSDVVQEALAEAAQELPRYVREQPLPFYPWLRRFAWQRLMQLHRHHIGAGKRSVAREETWPMPLPDESAGDLAERLIDHQTSPSLRLIRDELRQRVQAALDRLSPRDRELLIMRHLEEMSTAEIAAILGVSVGAVRVRLLRALTRLRAMLDDEGSGEGR
jgi:RNA polymerase sigma-70 factor (ECF subfamily)